MKFKKYSIFIYNKILNGKEYSKDYSYTFLYNKSGKSKFTHEYGIYCSNYFIKQLRCAKHWYIDLTFVIPPSFKQMLVVLYINENTGKRYPGLFGLINNKKLEGYIYMFKKIKDIITLEDNKDLSLVSYSEDYELALLNALIIIFPKPRPIGCYCHYCKNIYLNAEKKIVRNRYKKKDRRIIRNIICYSF